jgi:hypothetical protein
MKFRTVFWEVLPCKIIVDRRFSDSWCLHHPPPIPDDAGSTYLWNVGRQLFYTTVYPRRQFWTSYSPPWELEISQFNRLLALSSLVCAKVPLTLVLSFLIFWSRSSSNLSRPTDLIVKLKSVPQREYNTSLWPRSTGWPWPGIKWLGQRRNSQACEKLLLRATRLPWLELEACHSYEDIIDGVFVSRFSPQTTSSDTDRSRKIASFVYTRLKTKLKHALIFMSLSVRVIFLL